MIHDIIGDEWVDLYNLLGITVGDGMIIANAGENPLLIAESAVQPTSDKQLTLTTTNQEYAVVQITAGSGKIWCKPKRGSEYPSYINVETVV